jgi:PadR family transcriptional regulator, regulatory protein PadR
MNNIQKEAETRLTKGLMDMIVLQFLKNEPMHGYQIITKIRRNFGVYLGPSSVYPMLSGLEKKGYIKSTWITDTERPRKVFKLTTEGQLILRFTENTLNLICSTLTKAQPAPTLYYMQQ